MPSTPATRALDAAGLPYALHPHSHPVRSLAQAAAERGLRPGQIVRSLVFRLEGEVFVLVLAPGPGKVSWAKLRRHLAVSRLTTASPEEVERVTGYVPGGVTPFGLATQMRVLADRQITGQETVSVGAGIPNAGIVIATADLVRLVNPEFGDFLEEPGN